VSADYFGRFARSLEKRIGGAGDGPPFVALLSQGTRGDPHWMDSGRPTSSVTIDAYAEEVARAALGAYQQITYRDWVPLQMAETRLKLARRKPDAARLAWARPIVTAMGSRPPRSLPEVYAREAIYLFEEPTRELKLQAVRVGDLGIAAIPNEVFALTGLKIKARSPLPSTFTIELANGSEGYIPPPEQHTLGGYTTWPARTAGLEVQAEPKIVEAVLGLLEKVAGRSRRSAEVSPTPYSKAVLAARPWSYWRLEEMEGATAFDVTGREHRGHFAGGYALYLDGPEHRVAQANPWGNHAVHLSGGRITLDRARVPVAHSSVVFWFWNGLPDNAGPITGVVLEQKPGPIQVGLGGTKLARGHLYVKSGGPEDAAEAGPTEVGLKTWHHLALVRDGTKATVYLDGRAEVTATVPEAKPAEAPSLAIGGGEDVSSRFEGKVDEIAIFDRVLSEAVIKSLFEAGAGSDSR
jgi:hypothetical protein